jgi:3-hydroxyacyl-CoA dehydrogenase
MKAAGHPPAEWVEQMLAAGKPTFYEYKAGKPVAVYDPARRGYVPLTPDVRRIALGDLKSEGKELERNDSASLIDLGDGVACVEFHAKANAIDDDIWRC